MANEYHGTDAANQWGLHPLPAPGAGAGGGSVLPFFHDADLDADWLKLVSHHTKESDVTPGVVPVAGSIQRVTWTNDPETGKPLPSAPIQVHVNGALAFSFTANAETGVHVLPTPFAVAQGDRVAVFGAAASGDNRLKSPVITVYVS